LIFDTVFNIIANIVLLAGFTLFAAYTVTVHKKIFYPPVLFTLACYIYAAFSLVLFGFSEITPLFVLLMFAFPAAFLAGAKIVKSRTKTVKRTAVLNTAVLDTPAAALKPPAAVKDTRTTALKPAAVALNMPTAALKSTAAESTAGRLDGQFNHLGAYMFLLSCAAMLYPLIFLLKSGYGLSDLFSFSTLMRINDEAAIARYGGTEAGSWYQTLLLVVMYLVPLVGGTYVAKKLTVKRLACSFITLIPAFADLLLTNAKAGVLFAITFYLSAYLVMRLYNGATAKTPRSVKIVLAAGVVFLGIVVILSFWLRYKGTVALIDILRRIAVYAFGSGYAFSEWLRTADILLIYPEFGRYTFSGIWQFFFSVERDAGVFTETVQIPGWESSTNVYMLFRYIIQDFTLPGVMLFLLICGMLSESACTAVAKGRTGKMFVLIAVYLLIFWSSVTSWLTYNTLILAVILFQIFVSFEVPRKIKRTARSSPAARRRLIESKGGTVRCAPTD
jgi:oligosaccharide repeat unit polymerase